MFLLDTNVMSELRRPERGNSRVVEWASRVAQSGQFLSCVTVMELEIGALSLRRRDVQQGDALLSWIRNRVLPEFAGRILSFDLTTSLICAPLHVPNRRPQRDAIIAATAIEHRLTVVTRNVRDFADIDAPLLNPWDLP